MSVTIYPVIMCGGVGSRLWPKSRTSQPKQFLSLVENDSLLEATLNRLKHASADISVATPTVICGSGQEALVGKQLAGVGYEGATIIVEPFGRNTAAVAAVAGLHGVQKDPNAIILLLAADHYMQDPPGFWRGVSAGVPAANDGYLVTLGIQPTGPETGYGYIHKGEALGKSVYQVQNFKEKPDQQTAQTYLDTKEYFWNAGIFLFRADAMVDAFNRHAPDILSASQAALEAAVESGGDLSLDAEAFMACPSLPVDIAIMEKAERVAVVAPVNAGWSDVGSWSVVSELKNSATSGDVIALDCEGSLIETDGPTIAAIGLKDMIVIADGGSILIMPKDRAQDVKAIVAQLKADGRSDKL